MRNSGRLLALAAFAGLFAAAAEAQAASQPFTFDGVVPTKAEAAELLAAVCPGHVSVGKRATCAEPCPSYTAFAGISIEWSLERVTYGHFVSPASEDAALAMKGCEGHNPDNFSGTALVSRVNGRRVFRWYKPGDTSRCHRIPLETGRDVLLCEDENGGQGVLAESLYLDDFLSTSASLMGGEAPMIEVLDSTGACGENRGDNSFQRSSIRSVEFPHAPVKSGSPLAIAVEFGRMILTPEQIRSCTNGDLLPQVRNYTLRFIFDGHGFKLDPSSANAARAVGITSAR